VRWEDLAYPWQICLEEAWLAFKAGTIPIGAAVFDEDGYLLSRGRNRIYDQAWQNHSGQFGGIANHKLAHAELNALLAIQDKKDHFGQCVIYTAVEPCPLCMGAIYMMGICQVHVASRDPYAGSTNLLKSTQYLSRKPIEVHPPFSRTLEDVILGLNFWALVKNGLGVGEKVFNCWQTHIPDGIHLGKVLQEQKRIGVDLQ
jgi:tRNA(Arg) A34 adenosine deaminase TadA